MVFSVGTVSADTLSVSQTIHITGVVPPMRNIVVDGHGNILEITSNTPENVTPKVFLDSMKDGNETSLTAAILKDYESKIKGRDLRSTELHFTLPDPQAAKVSRPSWLTALSHMSWLRLSPLF